MIHLKKLIIKFYDIFKEFVKLVTQIQKAYNQTSKRRKLQGL